MGENQKEAIEILKLVIQNNPDLFKSLGANALGGEGLADFCVSFIRAYSEKLSAIDQNSSHGLS
jgi:hypothetical protein